MGYKELDPVLHAPLRLAVVSLLIGLREAEFTYIKETTESTAGNLSAQLTKLKEAGYIEIEKKFRKNYPLTICKITPKGAEAFEAYVMALKEYLAPAKEVKKQEDSITGDDILLNPV